MDSLNKNDYIEKKSVEKKLNSIHISIMERILDNMDLLKQYDGKKITKTFTDKLTDLFSEGDFVSISLQNRQYSDYIDLTICIQASHIPSFADKEKHLASHRMCNNVIYQYQNDTEQPAYCKTDRKFNCKNFIQCLKRTLDKKKLHNRQITETLEQIDSAIEKVTELRKHIDRELSLIPSPIRPYVQFDCPIWEMYH